MTTSNGRNAIINMMAKALYGLIITSILTLTGYVVANDKQSRDRDDKIKTELRYEIKDNRELIREKFEMIIQAIAELKSDVKHMKERIN